MEDSFDFGKLLSTPCDENCSMPDRQEEKTSMSLMTICNFFFALESQIIGGKG